MSSIFSVNTIRFIALVFTQVLVLNHINFFGYINPYIYILFIALYYVKNDRVTLIFLSFFLGIIVDLFLDTGGIHAAACLFIAYLRPAILKASFGVAYEYQHVKFNAIEFGQKLTYFSLLTVLHHLVLFSLEIFNFSKIILILQKTLFSSVFTLVLILLITTIFNRRD